MTRRVVLEFAGVLAFLAFGVGLVFAFSDSQTSAGAAFTVNTTADTADANVGNGTCSDSVGGCSLRAAIMEANAFLGEDTISLPAGVYTLSRVHGGNDDSGLNDDLDINTTGDTLTIVGDGSATTTIDGGAIGKVLEIISGGADISGVTIQNGSWGGDGGGILNWGQLNLSDSIVRNNRTTGSSGAGAGINNRGSLNLTNSTVSGNMSSTAAGGIYNGGSLLMTNSKVTGNRTSSGGDKLPDGGGIFNQGALTLIDSTIDGNTADRHGGGIFNRCDQIVCGTLDLRSSTVSRNVAINSGGGIYKEGTEEQHDVRLTLSNVTVSGNTANVHGGGVFNQGIASLRNVSISGNSSGDYGGGLYHDFPGSGSTLTNTIVANNTSSFGSNEDCLGVVASNGYNLDSDGSCGLTGTGDLPNTDPSLGPLADNGGATETLALPAGSPAINAGSADCPPPTADQRGVPRPQAGGCDIGAYEALDKDEDGDGVSDLAEAACGVGPFDITPPLSRPERIDNVFGGADEDGDTQIDEALPAGAATFDCDGDGFTGTAENHVYAPSAQGDQDPCGSNATPATDPPSPLGWPADLKGGGISENRIDISDLAAFIAPVRYFNTDVGTHVGDIRWDVYPGAGQLSMDINIQDLAALVVLYPPMLGGVKALGGPACPWGP